MRIAFDGTPLIGDRTGVGVYTYDLIDAMARTAPENDLLVFPISWRTSATVDAPRHPNVSVVQRFAPARLVWASWKYVRFPPVEWWVSCDVFHATNFVGPPTRRVPLVTTVHDLGFLHFPEACDAAVLAMSRQLPSVLRRTAAVVVVSEFVRDELSGWMPEVAERISVIPHGYHERRGPPSTGPSIPPGPPYVLVIGTLNPRKNLELVVGAIADLRARGVELRLVLAGRCDPLLDVDELVRSSDLNRDDVVVTGFVDDARIQTLLANAAVFAFPSKYEGFGLPLLEAMAAGVPVVAARAGATAEVAGDAAVLVDAQDAEAFADEMLRLLSDETWRGELVARGHRRAAAFTWEKTAEATLALYRQVAMRAGIAV